MDPNTNTDIWNSIVQAFIQFVSMFATFVLSFARQGLAAFLF